MSIAYFSVPNSLPISWLFFLIVCTMVSSSFSFLANILLLSMYICSVQAPEMVGVTLPHRYGTIMNTNDISGTQNETLCIYKTDKVVSIRKCIMICNIQLSRTKQERNRATEILVLLNEFNSWQTRRNKTPFLLLWSLFSQEPPVSIQGWIRNWTARRQITDGQPSNRLWQTNR